MKELSNIVMKMVNQIRLLREVFQDQKTMGKILILFLEKCESKNSSLEETRDLS